jgi:hypothetical protein
MQAPPELWIGIGCGLLLTAGLVGFVWLIVVLVRAL